MRYFIYVLLAFVIGLLIGALFKKKKTVAPAAASAAAASTDDDEIAAVIAAIAAAMGCSVDQVRILSLSESSPWKPTFMNTIGGQVDEKIPNKDKWKIL